MQPADRVRERMGAIMSVLRELTAECRQASDALGDTDGASFSLEETAKILVRVNMSLTAMRSRLDEMFSELSLHADPDAPTVIPPAPPTLLMPREYRGG
jgi:hypothetical protein